MASRSRSGGSESGGSRAFNRSEKEREDLKKAASKAKVDYNLASESIGQLVEAARHGHLLGVGGGMAGRTEVFTLNEFEGQDVAVKIMTPVTNQEKSIAEKVWKAETDWLEILNDKHHPNILKILKKGQDDERKIIIYELMDSDITSMIEVLNWNQMLHIMKDTATAIQFIHKQNPPICHNDIKPENLLIKDGTVRLGDFGSATPPGKMPPLRTYEYLPPSPGNADTKLDVYSFGVTALQIVNNIKTVDGVNNFEWKREKGHIAEVARKTTESDHLVNKNLIGVGGCTETKAKDLTTLLRSCCHIRPNSRPDIDEVLRVVKSMI